MFLLAVICINHGSYNYVITRTIAHIYNLWDHSEDLFNMKIELFGYFIALLRGFKFYKFGLYTNIMKPPK